MSSASAQERLAKFGRNELQVRKKSTAAGLLLGQFKSPLVLILVFAALISVFTGEWIDATIIIVIVIASAVLGFIQEYSASNAVEKLRSQVTAQSDGTAGREAAEHPGRRGRAGRYRAALARAASSPPMAWS